VQSLGIFRHLAIIIYDLLLLLALLFLATALVLPFNKGEAFATTQYFFPLYLLFISFMFYGWFWTHGGQTLGMKTWKTKLQTFNQQPITWKHAYKRFFMALVSFAFFGLGFLWKFVDKQKYTWHDHFSKTTLSYK
jgi:uncharacterized RDD family membrane protein YckC